MTDETGWGGRLMRGRKNEKALIARGLFVHWNCFYSWWARWERPPILYVSEMSMKPKDDVCKKVCRQVCKNMGLNLANFQ